MAVSSDMLAAFVKVADSASVSQAALELGVGKSVVSKRVAQLEEMIGATLFARSTRRIALTPAGEAYAEFARRALAEMSAGEERLRALRSELTGRIRMSATVSWGQRVLAVKLPEFLRLHPAIEVELQLGDRMVDVAYERIDIALRWSTTPPQGLVCEPVAVVGWSVVAAPGYLAEAGTPIVPADLARHSCLCYWREASDDLWALAHAGQMERVRVHGRYHVDNPEAVAEAAIAGLGIAMLPDYLCQDGLVHGHLVRVLPGWAPQTKFGSVISAVSTAERMRLSRNQALMSFLRQQLTAV
ncbi:MAG: LysR family transcriptional regulator [Burkholderiales bacterium]|nr:LysR family transcriptional regulator [Burkholderiales bacterium]